MNNPTFNSSNIFGETKDLILRNRPRAGNKCIAWKIWQNLKKRSALNKPRTWKIWQTFEVFVMKNPGFFSNF